MMYGHLGEVMSYLARATQADLARLSAAVEDTWGELIAQAPSATCRRRVRALRKAGGYRRRGPVAPDHESGPHGLPVITGKEVARQWRPPSRPSRESYTVAKQVSAERRSCEGLHEIGSERQRCRSGKTASSDRRTSISLAQDVSANCFLHVRSWLRLLKNSVEKDCGGVILWLEMIRSGNGDDGASGWSTGSTVLRVRSRSAFQMIICCAGSTPFLI
jgi:hypothetical protein